MAQALQDIARDAERPQERLSGAESPTEAPDGGEGPGTPGDALRATLKPATGPVLFLLDEFAALGRLEPVERAMGLMAGYQSYSRRQGLDEATTTTTNLTGRDLLTPDEIMQLPAHLQLLRLQGQPVTLARKLRYYADPEFTTLFDPDKA